MASTFEAPAELVNAVGQQLGCSDWVEITQERIDQFAEATGDHQWGKSNSSLRDLLLNSD